MSDLRRPAKGEGRERLDAVQAAGATPEKRSSPPESARLPPLPAGAATPLGGRQPASGTTTQGGGYQNVCAPQTSVAELAAAGIGSAWLAVAERIGAEQFLAAWQVLDQHPAVLAHGEGCLRLSLRRFSAYRRVERNKRIEALVLAGKAKSEIAAMLVAEFGDCPSSRHMTRLIAAARR